MSGSIPEMLDRIASHLDHAEWDQAGELVRNLQNKSDINDEQHLQLLIFRAQLYVDRNEPSQAMGIITRLINDISNWPKMIQLQILHIAGQATISTHDLHLAEIYTTKFKELYNNTSKTLQSRNRQYFADMKNVEGLIHMRTDKFESALSLFEKSALEQRRLNRPFKQAISLYNAGRTANHLQRSSRAETLLEESYRIFRDLNHLVGLHVTSKALITTYDLKGDEESKLSYIQIADDLENKIELQKMKEKKDREIKRLMDTNTKLRSQLLSVQSQLKNKEDREHQLEDQISLLQNKMENFQDINVLYEKLKDTIKHLEQQVYDQQKIINSQSDNIKYQKQQIANLEDQAQQMKVRGNLPGDLSIDQTELKELLESSKLIENLYHHLKDVSPVNLHILALQMRISQDRCEQAIHQMEQVGMVRVKDWENKNPEVELVV